MAATTADWVSYYRGANRGDGGTIEALYALDDDLVVIEKEVVNEHNRRMIQSPRGRAYLFHDGYLSSGRGSMLFLVRSRGGDNVDTMALERFRT